MPKKSKIIELQCGDCGQVFERLLRIHKEYLRLNKQKNKTDYVRNVSTNEKYFEMKNYMWDADVILHDHKIAVLWNGIANIDILRRRIQSRSTKINYICCKLRSYTVCRTVPLNMNIGYRSVR